MTTKSAMDLVDDAKRQIENLTPDQVKQELSENKFKRVQLTVENSFANTQKNSDELEITAYKRAFYKLTQDKQSIGKIFPVYLKIKGVHRILGIFTLNQSGTTSFFPELPGLFFDHITFGNKFGSDAHLTKILDGKRKKVTLVHADQLSNGTSHLVTFMLQNENLLKLAPYEIKYPEIGIQYLNELRESLFTRDGYNGSGILDATGDGNLAVVQILMIPPNQPIQDIQFSASVIKNFPSFFDFKQQDTNMHIVRFTHEYQDQYSFGFITFNYQTDVDIPLAFTFAANETKLYFNSEDTRLTKRYKQVTKDLIENLKRKPKCH